MNVAKTFEVSLVVVHEFTKEQALHILTDPNPEQSILEYLKLNPGRPCVVHMTLNNIATGLGEFLAENAIKETKQLTMPA